MNARRDPDHLIHAFLLEGAERLQDQVFDAVRADIERKRQRVVIGPWRMPNMIKLVPLGLGAAAVVLAFVVGAQLLGPATPSGVGGAPAPSPSPPASPTPVPSSSPSPAASPPPLTQSFTSTLHGISVSYPEGWTTQAATEPWADSTFPLSFPAPQVDWLYDSDLKANLLLAIASQPIGDATPEAWVAAQMASGEGCRTTEPITVDGATGLIGAGNCTVAVVTSAGRGYWIQLYTGGDDPVVMAPYDRAWFEEVLATVQLRPGAAVDVAPSASP